MVAFDRTLTRLNESIDRLHASLDDQMQITREVIRRNEIAFQQQGIALADMAEQVRANTAATWAMLDRLPPGGEPA